MPRRPRSHELETESRRAFELLLPSSWVVRKVDEDYGVDLEVEIFEGGEATGAVFRVQLKATDKLPKNGRISRGDIKAGTLTYWRTLDVPVLVVLYVAPQEKFYVRWAHSYDPHYARSSNPKTVTFAYDRRHQLSKGQEKTLARHVQLVRAIKRRDVGYPMPIGLKSVAGAHGHSAEFLRVHLRRAIIASQGLLVVVDEEDLSTTVALDGTSLRVTLAADVASATFHYTDPDLYEGSAGLQALVADIMIAIASLFLRIGETRAAVELVKRFGSASYIIRMPGGIELFADDFVANDYVSEAFSIIKNAIDARDGTVRDVAKAVLLHIFLHEGPGRLTRAESREMLTRLESRARIELAEGEARAAGGTYYALGEHYRAIGEWSTSLAMFTEALRHDPSYSKRGYFWRVRAAQHYELQQYDAAASDYRQAVQCGDSPEAAFLLSDVLMKAGRYAEALAVPLMAQSSDYYALGERIQRRVVETICAVTGLSAQSGTVIDDERLKELDASEDVSKVITALRETSALDPRLWYIFAKLQDEADGIRLSNSWLVVADLERDNPQLWAVAASAAILNGAEDHANDVCDSGIRWCGGDFINAIDELTDVLPEEPSSAIQAKVYERADMDKPRAPKTIRLVSADGTYEALELRS